MGARQYNNLKGEMLIGKDEQAFFEVWKPNSGKRDVYVWNGTSWKYKYSITHIVPGFEKPATLNTYKYANWREYTNHKVQMDDGNTPTPPPSGDVLAVTLTGPDELIVRQQGTYIAHIYGGVSPYVLTWSSDGFVKQSGIKAFYKWDKEGEYTITVVVKDANGDTAMASKKVKVIPFKVEITGPSDTVFYPKSMSSGKISEFGSINGSFYVHIKGYGNYDIVSLKINDKTLTVLSYNHEVKGENPKFLDLLNPQNVEVTSLYGIPLGDVTISVEVKEEETGTVKDASLDTHIDYGEPLYFEYKGNFVREERPVTVTTYKYPFLYVGEDPDENSAAYVKWITSDHNFGTSEAFKQYCLSHPNSSEAKQIVSFEAHPDSNSDGSAPVQGKSPADYNDAILNANKEAGVSVDNLSAEWFNTFNASLKGQGFTESKINSDGTTSIIKQTVTITEPTLGDGLDVVAGISTTPSFKPYYNEIARSNGSINSSDISRTYNSSDAPSPFTLDSTPELKFVHPDNSPLSFAVISTADSYSVKEYMASALQIDGNLTLYLHLNVNNVRTGGIVDSTGQTEYSIDGQTVYTDDKGAYVKTAIKGCKTLPDALLNSDALLTPNTPDSRENNGTTEPISITIGNGGQGTDSDGNPYNYAYEADASFTVHTPALVSPYYTDKKPKIVAVKITPSSVTFDDGTPQSVVINYVKDSGSTTTPEGKQSGRIYDSVNSSKVIALYWRAGAGVEIFPLHKGSGVLHFDKDDLGGPYGADITVQVNKDVGDISVKVNGIDVLQDNNNNSGNDDPSWNNINENSGNGWLNPVNSIRYSYKFSSNNGWRIAKFYEASSGEHQLGRTQYGSTLASAVGKIRPFDLQVEISCSGPYKVSFTVQYGDSSPLTFVTSNGTKSMPSTKQWIEEGISKAGTGQLYDSVQHTIQVSPDNGEHWFTLKTKTDTMEFEYVAGLQ